MKNPELTQHMDRAADAAAASAGLLWLADVETFFIIVSAAAAASYYVVAAWVKYRNRDDYRSSLKGPDEE